MPEEAQPTLFVLPPPQVQDPPLPTPPAKTPQAPEAIQPPEPVRPRRTYRRLRRGTRLERIEHFQAWLRGEMQDPEPPPAGLVIYPPIYQLKITLRGIRPPIWRRVLVPANVTLARLHRIIQNVMGWWNEHLYSFTIDDREYSEGEDEYAFGFRQAAGRRLFESDLRPRNQFSYLYDFGDGWGHVVLLERALQPDLEEQYPLCTAGARACPPEDCGGVGGYEELLRVLDDPDDEQHDSMLEWLGGSFDPEYFERDGANFGLRRAPVHEARSTRDRALAWRAQQLIQERPSRPPRSSAP